ncbi:MAG: Gfo/Idh/MocA family oxidoreductase, partial [Verrucomicrobiota bacterium]
METNQSNQEESGGLNLTRRNFVRSTTAAGIGIGAIGTSKTALGQEASKGKDLHIALIGCGAQGQALLNASKFVDGVKFKAVCDIWQPNLKRVAGQIRGYKMAPEGAPNGLPGMYETAEELFEKEPTIDAVFVAVPDFVHHTYTIMGLEAGKPVYCEKMMSNTIERARQMVQAQRSTGQLLQIGHQRRSNPRYLHARDTLTHDNQLLGWITHAYAQWNRATKSSNPLEWPEKYEIPEDKLREFGFKNMFEFRNWRMFAEYGGGAISDLGAHQIDLFNWFFGATPKSVIASGGVDYHHSYEQFDNVMAIYEYDIPNGTFNTDGVSNGSDTVTSRAYYQVLTTNGSQGFYEKFMGLNGTISINETATFNQVYRDSSAPDWEPYGQEGL